MADKNRGKKRRAPGAAGSPSAEATERRQQSDARMERRYEPKPGAGPVLTMIVASLACVALGAGMYARFATGEGDTPSRYHPYAIYMLVGGALVFGLVGLFGRWPAPVLRVGDAGLAEEKGSDLHRIGWNQLVEVLLDKDLLVARASGTTIGIPIGAHAAAAADFLKEARRRVPARVHDGIALAEVSSPGAIDEVPLEPPQIAGQHCKASGRLIAFEKDARLCGRCGELYHERGVPPRCVTCGARLR